VEGGESLGEGKSHLLVKEIRKLTAGRRYLSRGKCPHGRRFKENKKKKVLLGVAQLQFSIGGIFQVLVIGREIERGFGFAFSGLSG